MKEDYEFAKADLDEAQKIKPNDGSVKKLMKETKLLHKRVKLRKKLQKQCSNDAFLGDFESVFNLSVEFLEEATSTEEGEWHFETGHSEELLRRLLIFLAKEKKYCVTTASYVPWEEPFPQRHGPFLSNHLVPSHWKVRIRFLSRLRVYDLVLHANFCCVQRI